MLSSSGACVSGEWSAAPALNTGVGEWVVAPPVYEEEMEMGDMGMQVVGAATEADERTCGGTPFFNEAVDCPLTTPLPKGEDS